MPTRRAAELALTITGILGIGRGDVLASAGQMDGGIIALLSDGYQWFWCGAGLPSATANWDYTGFGRDEVTRMGELMIIAVIKQRCLISAGNSVS